jgi:ribosomal subunit interface protein
MDIIVHSEGFTLRESDKALIEEKIAHCEQYAPRALRARVTLKRISAHPSDKMFKASALIEVPGRDVRAEYDGAAPVAAVDFLVEKLERVLERKKTVKLAKRTKAPRGRKVAAESA